MPSSSSPGDDDIINDLNISAIEHETSAGDESFYNDGNFVLASSDSDSSLLC
jgi:hypothetical protein